MCRKPLNHQRPRRKGRRDPQSVEPFGRESCEGSSEAVTGAKSDEPPSKKKKKKKKSAEKQTEPSEDAGTRPLVVHESSGCEIAARAGEELSYPLVPSLEKKKRKKRPTVQTAPISSEQDNLQVSSERNDTEIPEPAGGRAPQVAPPTVWGSSSAPRKPRVEFPDHVEFK